MPFESGSTALMICSLSDKMPDDFLERLAKYSAGKLDDVKDEPTVGWVSGRHLLESEISDMTSICGGHLYVNLRKAERKIPSQLLKAICRREELAYMQANNMITVPKSERKRIKEDAIERNLMKMPPTISATPIIVDRALNVMYVGSASMSGFDLIAAEFARAMEIEPVPVTITELMIKLFRASDTDLPSLSFNGRDEGDAVPGRDFLTWLWYYAETNEGRLKIGDLGDFHLIIEGPLTFAFASDEARRATESVLKKGCPQISAEAKAALSVGKKLKKAKVLLAHGDAEKWTFTFDADNFTMTGLNLPEGEEMELNARFEERVGFLHTLHLALEEYFKLFARTVMSEDRAALEKDIRKWAEERESL